MVGLDGGHICSGLLRPFALDLAALVQQLLFKLVSSILACRRQDCGCRAEEDCSWVLLRFLRLHLQMC